MNIRENAIYGRQSVDRKDSISRSILDFATMMESMIHELYYGNVSPWERKRKERIAVCR